MVSETAKWWYVVQTKCSQTRCLCLALSILLNPFPECGAADTKLWAAGSQCTGTQAWGDGRQARVFPAGSGWCSLHWCPPASGALSGPKHISYALLTRITENLRCFWRTYSFFLPALLSGCTAELVRTLLLKMSALKLEQCVGTCVLRGRSKGIGLNFPTENILLNRERRVKTDLFGQISLSVNLNN